MGVLNLDLGELLSSSVTLSGLGCLRSVRTCHHGNNDYYMLCLRVTLGEISTLGRRLF